MGTQDDRRKNTTGGKIFLEGNQSKQMAPECELTTTKPKVSRCFLFSYCGDKIVRMSST